MDKYDMLEDLENNFSENVLDDFVCDVADSIASNVNNNGVKAQLDFLLANGVSEDNIKEFLDDNDHLRINPFASDDE